MAKIKKMIIVDCCDNCPKIGECDDGSKFVVAD
jgi:hypothetical protein